MGVGMAVLAALAMFRGDTRIRMAVGAGLAIAALSPVMTNLPWGGTPALVQEYLVPGAGRGRFPFFPCVAYIAFGQAIGAMVKRTAAERFERFMQWSMLVGFAAVFIGQYFSNIPYSVYPKSSFWTDSPALVVIRVGICLMIMAGAYLWTEYCVGAGWSWMQAMGKNSLMVYWVHVMIVYGSLVGPIKRTLSIAQGALATAIVTVMMVAMSALWLAWKSRQAARRAVAPAAS
jgi:fucose 4-O-acetylase-like acetyltransferase